jgi:hypothetical protein
MASVRSPRENKVTEERRSVEYCGKLWGLPRMLGLLRTRGRTKESNSKSVALVCERTTPTERPPLVGEVTANFCGQSDVK